MIPLIAATRPHFARFQANLLNGQRRWPSASTAANAVAFSTGTLLQRRLCTSGPSVSGPERAVGRQASGLPPNLTQKLSPSGVGSSLSMAAVCFAAISRQQPRVRTDGLTPPHARKHCAPLPPSGDAILRLYGPAPSIATRA